MTIVSCFFFFKQKTAYDMRISDWSSDVCSSDLRPDARCPRNKQATAAPCPGGVDATHGFHRPRWCARASAGSSASRVMPAPGQAVGACRRVPRLPPRVLPTLVLHPLPPPHFVTASCIYSFFHFFSLLFFSFS